MSFMTIVVMFPTTPNPAASTMNYTVVVLGGVLILALVYFYLPVYGGVHWFQGPVRTVSRLVEDKVGKSFGEFGGEKMTRESNVEEVSGKESGVQSSVKQVA